MNSTAVTVVGIVAWECYLAVVVATTMVAAMRLQGPLPLLQLVELVVATDVARFGSRVAVCCLHWLQPKQPRLAHFGSVESDGPLQREIGCVHATIRRSFSCTRHNLLLCRHYTFYIKHSPDGFFMRRHTDAIITLCSYATTSLRAGNGDCAGESAWFSARACSRSVSSGDLTTA